MTYLLLFPVDRVVFFARDDFVVVDAVTDFISRLPWLLFLDEEVALVGFLGLLLIMRNNKIIRQ